MSRKLHLDGISIPITTPFDASGAVDIDALKKNIGLYNQHALSGYVPCGSTGESPFLSKDDKLKIFEAVKAMAAPGRTLLAGAAYESVYETVKMANAAAAIGCDAALLLAPHYYRGLMTNQEAQLAYYRAVADASKIPVVIYNFPQITGLDVSAESVAKLAEHGNIAGIKESSGDLVKIQALVDQVPADFPVTVGNAGKYFASLEIGVTGGVLGVADILPAESVELHRLYRAGDIAGAKAQQERIAEACDIPPRFGIPGTKYAMDLRGFAGGKTRLPLLPLAEEDKPKIAAIFARLEAHATIVA